MNKTKLKIITQAQEMFTDHSFDGTALDKLLGQIKVSKGSFFHHFKSKDDLLLELLDYESQKLFQTLESLFENSQNPINTLNKFIDWRYQNTQNTGRLISKLGTEAGNRNLIIQKKLKKIYGNYLSYLIEIIEKAKQTHQLIETTPTKELANFILYGLEGGNMSTVLVSSHDHYTDVVEMIKRMIRSFRNLNFAE